MEPSRGACSCRYVKSGTVLRDERGVAISAKTLDRGGRARGMRPFGLVCEGESRPRARADTGANANTADGRRAASVRADGEGRVSKHGVRRAARHSATVGER